MKRLVLISLSICLMLNTVSSFAWGPMGHDVVAAIAEQNLSKKAKKAINQILEGKSIVYYASWMDSIQNSPEWKGGYDKTKTWHYCNVDKGYTYDTMPKCPTGDVVTALQFLTKELTENFDKLSDKEKADYLKMVIHVVGDMHCPMHAGRLSDRGGNNMKIKWFGQQTNLHSLWDSKLIESARRWGYQEWTEQLNRLNKKEIKALTVGTYEDWFRETVARAAEIYDYAERTGEEVPSFSYQYIWDFSPLLENRLQTGGYRLAYVLNTIFN